MFICLWAQGISSSPKETEGLLLLSMPLSLSLAS